MIIDSHAHVILPPHRQLQLMDEAKIDCTVLFTSTIHPETSVSLEELEGELNKLYRILNGIKNPLEEKIASIEQLAEIVKENPARYLGFGSIPLGLSFAENLDWIAKHILANGFCGIGELTPGSGQISQIKPLFQASHETGSLPLWVHAFFPLNFEDIKELLVLAKEYPTVPVIIGHLGGIHWLNLLKEVKDLSNVYLDLSAIFTTMAPAFAIKEYPERTLFASDAPYSSPLTAKTILEQTVQDPNILKLVLGGNMARLLKK